ncbi:MAG TPA: histidine phosphatase family protein [Gammaproteobacteria bacterium]|jgi:2,3-bisphosphoglycerate-dependent phosphoglycerate mutase
MARLIAAIIRHADYQQLADTPSAHQPFPLTEAGKAEALAATQSLNDFLLTGNYSLSPEIDCSNMLRAWQTAEIIATTMADQFPAPPLLKSFDALAERGVGSVANLTVSQIENIMREDPRFDPLPVGWKSDSHFRLPFQGAESLLEAGERVATHLQHRMQAMQESVTGDTIKLFVGHGAAFRHAAFHLGVLSLGQVPQLSMYHARPILLEYRSDGGWLHVDGEWKAREAGHESID